MLWRSGRSCTNRCVITDSASQSTVAGPVVVLTNMARVYIQSIRALGIFLPLFKCAGSNRCRASPLRFGNLDIRKFSIGGNTYGFEYRKSRRADS